MPLLPRFTLSPFCSFRTAFKTILLSLLFTFCIFTLFSASIHTYVTSDSPRDIPPLHYTPSNSQLAPQYINPHSFNFTILETEICSGDQAPFLLAVVHTHPANYKRRMVIRETWGAGGGPRLLVLFAMGLVGENPGLMRAVRSESERYRDIIQENFQDSYRNLTHKAIMWLKWTSLYCPNVAYLLKIDDDIFVNTFNLMIHLKYLYDHHTARNRSILCLVWRRMPVMRDRKSKWYVTKEEYPNDYFHQYCSGSAYIITGDLLEYLYKAALRTKFFWVDDFYTTGLLPRVIGNIEYHNIASLYALKQAEVREKLVYNNAIFGHVPGSISLRYKLWKEILDWRGEKK